ncbi:hypothetical protein AGMMS50229_19510 [Campylobacterota bacterium]|nr:hypothetical protein AGMMS50229_19510 [Campylobacterota bacterium]
MACPNGNPPQNGKSASRRLPKSKNNAGKQSEDFSGDVKKIDRMFLMFEFPEETIEIDGEMTFRQLSIKVTKSMNEKATLRKLLISWRGRDFTPEEMSDFELTRLLGVPATVSVAHRESKGKTVAFISGISKPMRTNRHDASRKIYFDLNNESTWQKAHDIPKWILETINRSAEAVEKGLVFSLMKNDEPQYQPDEPGMPSIDDSIPF